MPFTDINAIGWKLSFNNDSTSSLKEHDVPATPTAATLAAIPDSARRIEKR